MPTNLFIIRGGGNPTDDSVFLLSFLDAVDQSSDLKGSGKYFSCNAERKVKATTYAMQKGVQANTSETTSNPEDESYCGNVQYYTFWWLRSPGDNNLGASLVWPDGVVGSDTHVDDMNIGVRPALWVNADKD